jgi:hypothetical protein
MMGLPRGELGTQILLEVLCGIAKILKIQQIEK